MRLDRRQQPDCPRELGQPRRVPSVGFRTLARGGDPARGITILRDAMAGLKGISAENIDRPLWLSQLAAAHADLGQIEVGLGLLDQAMQVVETTSERCFEAEIHRLRGEIFRISDRQGEAEAEFQYALTVARKQGARWWELRTATTLARDLQSEGQYTEARDLLAPIYSWFTEGLDLPHLQEAKALLEELRSKDRLTAGTSAIRVRFLASPCTLKKTASGQRRSLRPRSVTVSSSPDSGRSAAART